VAAGQRRLVLVVSKVCAGGYGYTVGGSITGGSNNPKSVGADGPVEVRELR
jgi:hypothetical protein